MYKQILVLFFLVAAVAAETAYFAFKTHGTTDEFVFKLTDDKRIKHARDLLSGATDDEPYVMGRIRKQTASYNPKYSFHLDPEAITFFNMAIEVCDATLPYLEEHLDEACGAFLPGCFYCPWTSKLTREVKDVQ
ncbi:uncharacterized protein EV154DRAFT_554901 [Mucor mucedo]|uniref:uncharacterized protein n=1 Tax=Mucor mucedo TaxID=29922 RepID=UPI0022208521|nr:uncharacterized protein EV154DRAFT_554901 [Mucor mucedo]KAI7884484.1 hypothetical protein EV154DRAFT_554901 [Mucor mucedo]